MTGDDDAFISAQDERLQVSADGQIQSPFWEYE
jgi:selenophosphate synthetase-related protein